MKPDISFLYNVRGGIYRELKQYKMAIDDYTRAIDLKPDRHKYYMIRYAPFKELGYSQEELNEMMKGFSAELDLYSLYHSRAGSYKENLQINEAIKDYEKTITIYPDSLYPDSLAFFSLRELYEQEDRLKDAISFYSHVITIYPKIDSLYRERAYFYEKLKQYDKAIKDYSKAIAIEPHGYYFSSRGSAYSALKQYDKAIKDFTKAIALASTKPDHSMRSLDAAWGYSLRGEIYMKTDQKQKALEDFQKACDLTKAKLFCDLLRELQREIARGKRWDFVSKTKNESYYYDKTSIRQQPNKNKRVWIRKEVDDVNIYLKEVKNIGLPATGYENFSFQVDLLEIDCNGKSSGNVSFVNYDDKGNILNSFNHKAIEMHPIVPYSIGESFYKVVCEGKKN